MVEANSTDARRGRATLSERRESMAQLDYRKFSRVKKFYSNEMFLYYKRLLRGWLNLDTNPKTTCDRVMRIIDLPVNTPAEFY